MSKIKDVVRQRGIALLSVMTMVAIMAVIGAGFFTSQSMALKKTANHLNYLQACQYAVAAEEFAKQVLWEDWDKAEQDNNTDHYDGPEDIWTRKLLIPSLDAIGSSIVGEVKDMHTKFNLNNLYNSNGKLIKNVDDSVEWQQLKDILEEEGLEEKLVYHIYDWLDQDTAPHPRALDSEDEGYQDREPPYRTPNLPLQHLSELRLIKDIGAKEYAKLLPHLVLLPEGATRLNVNTADPKVLARLFVDVDSEDLKKLREEEGGKKGFEKLKEFEDQLVGGGYANSAGAKIWSRQNANNNSGVNNNTNNNGNNNTGTNNSGNNNNQNSGPTIPDYLDVISSYFEVRVIASYDERICNLVSVLRRDPGSGKVYLVSRNHTERVEFSEDDTSEEDEQT